MTLTISAIYARDEAGGIGQHGGLPWPRNREDLARFKQLTQGHYIVFGRKTINILPPLPDRKILMLSDSLDWPIARILNFIKTTDETELFIGGGAQTFAAFSPYITRVYATIIRGSYAADTRLPVFPGRWLTEDVREAENCTFQIWEKITTKGNF